MTDQTPDPWKTVFMRTAGTCVPGMWVYPADEVSEALAAERAQHQQALIDQRVIGHAEGQAHAIADVNAGRIDDLIVLRLAQHQQEIAQRDETIRQLRDAFARCQEVQQATAETWRIEHDQMAEQIRLLRGAMAADDERLRRAAEQAGILYVSCDTAEALAEQITRLSAQVAELEAEQAAEREAELADPVAQRADRYAAEASDLTLRLIAAEAERDAAQQQIATLTQELSVSRANHIDANQRNMQSVRELEAAEARCATLQGAVAADEERLRQAAARAGVLFVGCDTADALADRCATLTAAMEQLRDCDWTIGRGDRMDPVRDIARAALSGVPTP